MYWRLLGYVAVGLIILALSIGLGVKITQKAEGYKATTQNFYTSENHFLFPGCAYYRAPMHPTTVPNNKK